MNAWLPTKSKDMDWIYQVCFTKRWADAEGPIYLHSVTPTKRVKGRTVAKGREISAENLIPKHVAEFLLCSLHGAWSVVPSPQLSHADYLKLLEDNTRITWKHRANGHLYVKGIVSVPTHVPDMGRRRAEVKRIREEANKNREILIESLPGFLASRGGFDTFHEWGRALYKSTFGPWVCALLRDGNTLYYEDEAASKKDWHKNCVGIRVGSIIEGADYDAQPFDLLFPFTEQDFERNFKELEGEVSYEWEKNNSNYYQVREVGSEEVLTRAMWTQFDDKPKLAEEELEALVIAGVEEFNKDYHPVDKWIPFEFEGKQYEISEYQEDWY